MSVLTPEAETLAATDAATRWAFRARLDALRLNRRWARKIGSGASTVLRKTRLDALTSRIIGGGRWVVSRLRPVASRVANFGAALGRIGLLSAALLAASTDNGRSLLATTVATATAPVRWAGRKFLGGLSWVLGKMGSPGKSVDRAIGSGILKVASIGYRFKLRLSGGIIGRNLATDSETMRVVAGLAGGVLVYRVAGIALSAAGLPVNALSRGVEMVALGIWCIRVLYKRSWTARSTFNKIRRQVQPLPVIVADEFQQAAPAPSQATASSPAPSTQKVTMEDSTTRFVDDLLVVAKASNRTIDELIKECDAHIGRLIENHNAKNGKSAPKGAPTPPRANKPRERSPEAAAKR